jgi:protein-disulfide isomerase
VVFDYKFLPLEIHSQANSAALASVCALEQGKFWEYADKLYADQTIWGGTKDTNKFKEYARGLKLDGAKFNQCLDSKKYQEKIDKDIEEASGFGISGTPGVFVNDQFQEGAVSYEQLKTSIEAELAK